MVFSETGSKHTRVGTSLSLFLRTDTKSRTAQNQCCFESLPLRCFECTATLWSCDEWCCAAGTQCEANIKSSSCLTCGLCFPGIQACCANGELCCANSQLCPPNRNRKTQQREILVGIYKFLF